MAIEKIIMELGNTSLLKFLLNAKTYEQVKAGLKESRLEGLQLFVEISRVTSLVPCKQAREVLKVENEMIFINIFFKNMDILGKTSSTESENQTFGNENEIYEICVLQFFARDLTEPIKKRCNRRT